METESGDQAGGTLCTHSLSHMYHRTFQQSPAAVNWLVYPFPLVPALFPAQGPKAAFQVACTQETQLWLCIPGRHTSDVWLYIPIKHHMFSQGCVLMKNSINGGGLAKTRILTVSTAGCSETKYQTVRTAHKVKTARPKLCFLYHFWWLECASKHVSLDSNIWAVFIITGGKCC